LRKIIVAPDSFKGSLGARQVADIISEELLAACPDCRVVKLPLADGGEGSVETIIAATGGSIEEARILSPDDRQITAAFGITPDGKAVLEMAQSSGITRQIGLHPMTSSTYGFGQLILHALEMGLRDFYLCIGGSATTDGGCGMAAALGVEFLDESGRCFVPCGATLENISGMDVSSIDPRVSKSSFTVLCDVNNPLYGTNGAAHIYGPQKGASPQQVLALDRGLRHVSDIVVRVTGVDYSQIPGAGAAGGLGFGCLAMLGAHLASGIDTILHLCDFREHTKDADLIITGEGKLDAQSFAGKALSGVLHLAKDIPIVSICGINDCDESLLREHNLTVFETSDGIPIEESLRAPEKYLRIAAAKVGWLYR